MYGLIIRSAMLLTFALKLSGVDFAGLEYGASLGFAAIGTNAGHDDPLGFAFWGAPEVLNDFAWRSLHLEAVVGKELVHSFYGSPATHSYYSGCSQGGRQGFHAAEVSGRGNSNWLRI